MACQQHWNQETWVPFPCVPPAWSVTLGSPNHLSASPSLVTEAKHWTFLHRSLYKSTFLQFRASKKCHSSLYLFISESDFLNLVVIFSLFFFFSFFLLSQAKHSSCPAIFQALDSYRVRSAH